MNSRAHDQDASEDAPGDAPTPRELGWGEAARRVLLRYLRRAVRVGVIGAVGMAAFNQARDVLAVKVILMILVVVAAISALMFPASVLDEVNGSREAVRQRELLDAIARVGADAPAPSDRVRVRGLRHLVLDSSATVLVAAFIEVAVFLPIVAYLAMIPDRPIMYSFALISAATFAVAFPVCIIVMNLFVEEDELAGATGTARVERAYREAVEDRSQLAGGLALDEHVGASGGGALTVQAEAGGLEVHDEVALDLDAEQKAVDRHVEQEQKP